MSKINRYPSKRIWEAVEAAFIKGYSIGRYTNEYPYEAWKAYKADVIAEYRAELKKSLRRLV